MSFAFAVQLTEETGRLSTDYSSGVGTNGAAMMLAYSFESNATAVWFGLK